MSDERRIPIIIGVTAHRNIRKEDGQALKKTVEKELAGIRDKYPSSPVKLLSSLAEGGDSLCAHVALDLGIGLISAIPFERDEFAKDFDADALKDFEYLISKSEKVMVTPDCEGKKRTDRDYCYRQNGIYIASHCNILLALWDGCEGKPDGCGTAEAVAFALDGDYTPKEGIPLKSRDNTDVIHIAAPRDGDEASDCGAVKYLGCTGKVEKDLKRIDDFNKEASGLEKADAQSPLSAVYACADTLSMDYARKHNSILKYLAFFGSIIALAFLAYDELELRMTLIVCGLMLVLSFGTLKYATKSLAHDKYISYRALAESERVRDYLRYAGSGIEITQLLTATQRSEQSWVMHSLNSLDVAQSSTSPHDITECWIGSQLEYHENALDRTRNKYLLSARVLGFAASFSVCVYIFALVCEILGALDLVAVGETMRTAVKIILGTVSAATLFINAYYGKQSLSRQSRDHEKMARFYKRMEELMLRDGQSEELLKTLAREELIENGNWCSYNIENSPGLEV